MDIDITKIQVKGDSKFAYFHCFEESIQCSTN